MQKTRSVAQQVRHLTMAQADVPEKQIAKRMARDFGSVLRETTAWIRRDAESISKGLNPITIQDACCFLVEDAGVLGFYTHRLGIYSVVATEGDLSAANIKPNVLAQAIHGVDIHIRGESVVDFIFYNRTGTTLQESDSFTRFIQEGVFQDLDEFMDSLSTDAREAMPQFAAYLANLGESDVTAILKTLKGAYCPPHFTYDAIAQGLKSRLVHRNRR